MEAGNSREGGVRDGGGYRDGMGWVVRVFRMADSFAVVRGCSPVL